jgi:hypothetical protein
MATTKTKKKAVRRTTLRSSKGTKLYAVRNADGTFKDIQSYKRAHAADLRQTSKAEAATSKKKKTKPVKRKATKARPAKKKAPAKKK